MGRVYDPIAETRALICQFNVTDDGAVLFNGRAASPQDLKVLKGAAATLEELLQQMVDRDAFLPTSPTPCTPGSGKSGAGR